MTFHPGYATPAWRWIYKALGPHVRGQDAQERAAWDIYNALVRAGVLKVASTRPTLRD